MKKIFTSLLLIAFLSSANTFAQIGFTPVIENGVFYLYYNSSRPSISKVEIYNNEGVLVKETEMAGNKEKTIECNDLDDGDYIVIVEMHGQQYFTPLEIKSENLRRNKNLEIETVDSDPMLVP